MVHSGLALVLMAWCRARAVCSADGAPAKKVYPATAREWSSSTTVSHGRTAVPFLPRTMMSSRVWSDCHCSFGRAAVRRKTNSKRSRYALSPWCASVRRLGSMAPMIAWMLE